MNGEINMREIECKFQIQDKKELLNRLKEKGCSLEKEITQKDTIFVQDIKDTESKPNSIWLRVRKTNNTIELNYKKQSKKKSESKEIEFQVNDYDKAIEFLIALGFQKWVEVQKKRITTTYQNFNICIDEVERLGAFVEIEMLASENDSIDYEPIIMSVAKELQIDTKKRINSHYDTMIAEVMECIDILEKL